MNDDRAVQVAVYDVVKDQQEVVREKDREGEECTPNLRWATTQMCPHKQLAADVRMTPTEDRREANRFHMGNPKVDKYTMQTRRQE